MVGWYCLPDKGYRPTRPKPPSYPPWGKIDYVLRLRSLIAPARFFTFHFSLFTIEKVTPILRWYCLPDSPPRHGFNPETSSRVTLASLGIAFQAKVIR